jgi:glycosyltransferase involved in cell wall biosynthesis
MAAYNAAGTIAHAIDSVLEQSYAPLEVIVVDDGSSDGTAAVLARYGSRIQVISQPNRGLAAARERGMAAARGRYIAWFDADDWWHPTMVERRVAVLEARCEVIAVSTAFVAFDADGLRPDVTLNSYYANLGRRPGGLAELYPEAAELVSPSAGRIAYRVGNLHPALLLGNVVHPPTLMFRRAILPRCGMPDSSLICSPDWDYLLRVARCGPMAVLPEPLLRYRLSPGQRSGAANRGKIQQSIVQIIEKAVADDPSLRLSHAAMIAQRLGEAHADATEGLAETEKLSALYHLAMALRYRRLPTAAALAKLALPVGAIAALRRRRARQRAALAETA